MILDGHIHMGKQQVDPALLKKLMRQAGVDGGVILSFPPASFKFGGGKEPSNKERLNAVMAMKGKESHLYPFYWIDPLEKDAIKQVEVAAKAGVNGFKIICNRYYPGDARSIKVFKAIAQQRKPILFHSGILWDGAPSSKFNRPGEFECLLEIDNLKFALAHISWPWTDECIAVYGKFLNAYHLRPNLSVEMFIDVTPGTPPIYRKDALKRLFTVGYKVMDNVFFGTDCSTDKYKSEWAREWIRRDSGVYSKLGIGPKDREKIFSGNLLRFLGLTKDLTRQEKVLRNVIPAD